MAELPRKGPGGNGPDDGSSGSSDHHQRLGCVRVDSEAVRIRNHHLLAVPSHRDADGRWSYRYAGNAGICGVAHHFGGIETEHGIAVARRDPHSVASRRNRQAYRAASGGHTGHHSLGRVGPNSPHIHDEDGAFGVLRLRLLGVLAFGLAADGPIQIFRCDLAGGVEQLFVGGEGEGNGRVAGGNLADDCILLETVAARLLQVDHRNSLRVLVADEEQFVIFSRIDVHASREAPISDVTEDGVTRTGSHARHIQKNDVIVVGDDQHLAVMRQRHPGRTGLHWHHALQGDRTGAPAQYGYPILLARI